MVDEVAGEIDGQVRAYEDRAKLAKREGLERYYHANARGLSDVLPFERALNPKWLNKTFNGIAATEEMFKIITRAKADIATIESFRSPYEVQMKDRYLSTLNLSDALAEKGRLEELARKTDSPAQGCDVQSHSTDTLVIELELTTEQRAKLRQFLAKEGISYQAYRR